MSISLVSSNYQLNANSISLLFRPNANGSNNSPDNNQPAMLQPGSDQTGGGAPVVMKIDLSALFQTSDGDTGSSTSQASNASVADAQGVSNGIDQFLEDLLALLSAAQTGDQNSAQSSAANLANDILDLIGNDQNGGNASSGTQSAANSTDGGSQAGNALFGDFLAKIKAEYQAALNLGQPSDPSAVAQTGTPTSA